MLRAFDTHEIRECRDLEGLWSFDNGRRRTPVCVPGCWESVPGLERYRGRAVISREVETAAGHYRIDFKGVTHTARVLWDGVEIARHYNGYTPFEAVAAGVSAGRHTLSVEVDNSFGEASALHVPNDYMTYGGITRGVSLERVPDVYIRWAHFTPERKGGGWTAEIALCLRNVADEDRAVRATAECAGVRVDFGEIRVPAGELSRVTARADFPADVIPYEPDAPHMYPLRCRAASASGEDDLVERVGFREIRVEGRDILFNGKPLRLRGFNRHEDHPMFGCSLPLAAMEADIQLMLDMGANSVRTCHYPNDELFLDLCDEQGILVWEEAHARGLTEARMRNPNFLRQSLDCVDEMILNHYNHPSIYIWGILNECASETEYGRNCYRALYDRIASLDSSRPMTSASCKQAAGWHDPDAADPAAGMDLTLGMPQVISYNMYPGWYVNVPDTAAYIRETFDGTRRAGGDKPIILSETGAGAVYGYRSPKRDKWTEERQCEILEACVEGAFALEDLTALYLWQFCDCRVTEEEWFNGRPRTMNNKGLVDEYRRPKLAYETVKRLFTRRKEDARA